MTITIVCDILGEENNGTTIACMNLIRYLRAQGHTVRVVCADQDKAGNECFYVVPERNLYLLNPIVERNGVTLPRVDRSILEEAIRDCDVVHTTFVLRLSHTAVKIAKAYNKPITSSFHCQAENVTAHFLCKDSAAINRGVYRACYQMVYQYSDIIHYPTQFIRDTFEAVVGPTNGRVISNGVNSMFTPGPATRPEGLEDKFLIVSTGRLSSEKNQEILIKAIGRSAHREQIHLILAGEGPREAHYRYAGPCRAVRRGHGDLVLHAAGAAESAALRRPLLPPRRGGDRVDRLSGGHRLRAGAGHRRLAQERGQGLRAR